VPPGRIGAMMRSSGGKRRGLERRFGEERAAVQLTLETIILRSLSL
jgi:hypothetical protein